MLPRISLQGYERPGVRERTGVREEKFIFIFYLTFNCTICFFFYDERAT